MQTSPMWNLEFPFDYIRFRLPEIVTVEQGSDRIATFRFPTEEDEQNMPCYGIFFRMKFDRERFPNESRLIARAIRCLDRERAIYIAFHMLGEEVSSGKTLAMVLSVNRIDPAKVIFGPLN